MKKNIIVSIVLLLMVGVGSFFIGKRYQQKILLSKNDQQNFPEMHQKASVTRPNFNKNLTEGEIIMGEITSLDEQSISITMPDGSSKLVLLSQQTRIQKTIDGTMDDLAVGIQVAVSGEMDGEGIVLSKSISIVEKRLGQ